MKKLVSVSFIFFTIAFINGCVTKRYASNLERMLNEERNRRSVIESELEQERKWNSEMGSDLSYLRKKFDGSKSDMKKYQSILKNKDNKINTLQRIIKLDNRLIEQYREFLKGFIAASSAQNPEEIFATMVVDKHVLDELLKLEKKRKYLIGK
jgi:peptidoglycan hydrolase CwlO-like protein